MKERLAPLFGLARELRRRKVIHVAAVYLGGALVGLDALNNTEDMYGLPDGLQLAFTVLVIMGFPLSLLASWWYEWTSQGIRRVEVDRPPKPVSRLAAVLASVLVIAAGSLSVLVAAGSPGPGPDTEPPPAGVGQAGTVEPPPGADGSTVLGILPVEHASANGDLAWLADALAGHLEDALAGIPAFTVIYRRSLENYRLAGIPSDSLPDLPRVDYLVSAQVTDAPGGGVTVLLKLIDGRTAEVVGNDRITLSTASPEAISTLVLRAEEVLRPALGEQHRLKAWRAGTSDSTALRLRYQAQERFATARDLAHLDWRAADREFAAADSILATVIDRDPQWVDPYVARARVAGQWALTRYEGDRERATEIFDLGIRQADAALQHDADNADALGLRGRLRWRKANLAVGVASEERARLADRAETDLRAALALDPHQVLAAASLSELLYWARGSYGEAMRFALDAYHQDAYMERVDEVINRIAISAFQLGDDQAALEWSRRGLRRFPNVPSHQGTILDVMAWGGVEPAVDEAWQHFEAVTTAGPGPATRSYYRFAMAAILARAGMADSARAVLRREIESLSPKERARRLDLEAGVRFRLGDTARGRTLFQELQETDPEEARRAASRRVLRDFVRASG